MMQTPSTPRSIAPAVGVGVERRVRAARAPAAARRRRLASRRRRERLEERADERFMPPSRRLQRDVAGEAVGDHDVDVVGHEVAALDVADEVDARRAARSSSWVSFTSGLPLRGLLADRQQADPRARRCRSGARGEDRAHLGELHQPLGLAPRRWRRRRAAPSASRPGTGIGVAIAGRVTPLMRPMRSSALAIVAPVLPARDHGATPCRRGRPRRPARARSPSCGGRAAPGRRPSR